MMRPALELLTPDSPSSSELKDCLSVIVPVYNEVDHVDELIQAVRNSPVEKEIIIVDDGSTDGTREKLRGMAPGIVLVFHQTNCGKGAAIHTGSATRVASTSSSRMRTWNTTRRTIPSCWSRFAQGKPTSCTECARTVRNAVCVSILAPSS